MHSNWLCAGVVYSFGRKEYGRLGLGKNGLEEKSKPTIIPKLRSKRCVHVDCGTAVSYAVASDGVFSSVLFLVVFFVSFLSAFSALIT